MKRVLFCLGLALITGCGGDDGRQAGHRVTYPALNESPPPPLLPESRFPSPLVEEPVSEDSAVGVVEDSLMQRSVQKEELIQSLREYSAKAEPDDPFALTKEEIDELSKVDGLIVF